MEHAIRSSLGGTWGGITLSSDGLEAYAVRNVTDAPERIYRVTRKAETEEFGDPEELAGWDPDVRLTDPALSPDGLSLYYTVIHWDQPLDSGDIFTSRRSSPDERFAPGTANPALNDPNYLDADPFVSHDGTTLYFTSRRNGGDYDIFSWQMDPLSSPVPLLSVNTSATVERCPVLTDDGLTIFFSSNRGASGAADIYMTQRSVVTDGFRQEAQLLGATRADGMEYPEAVSHDGCTLWYSATRMGISNIMTTTRGRD